MDSRRANFREILYGGFALRHTDRQIHVWLKWSTNNRRTARACGAELQKKPKHTTFVLLNSAPFKASLQKTRQSQRGG
jgi:hypothetical protein